MTMKSFTYRQQQGSVLIVVLVMLVLLTLIGTWAIKGSLTSLNISTNAQAKALLMQNSDSVFYSLENYTKDDLKFANMQIGDGIINFVDREDNTGKELVFCIRGSRADNFEGTRHASVIYWDGKTIKNSDQGKNGYCQTNRLTDFLSGRKAVMTQVAIRTTVTEDDWDHMVEGTNQDEKADKMPTITVTATSILPNLSSADKAEINKCLMDYTSFVDDKAANKTVTDCLAELGVPYSTQDMQYQLRSVKTS